jgi:molybdate/tungstate transport system ATP-binding protein
MLDVRELRVRRGSLTLYVERLQVYKRTVLLGRNGAGKSTLLMTLVGLLRPESGSISLDGEDVTDLPPERRGFGYLPQLAPTLPLGPREALEYFSKKWRRGYEDVVRQLRLDAVIAKGVLSPGERQLLNIALLLLKGPKLLLLDEPTAVLDWENKKLVWRSLEALDMPMLYVTHDPVEALLIGDQVILLSEGRLKGPLNLDRPGEHAELLEKLDLYRAFEGEVQGESWARSR